MKNRRGHARRDKLKLELHFKNILRFQLVGQTRDAWDNEEHHEMLMRFWGPLYDQFWQQLHEQLYVHFTVMLHNLLGRPR